jgi:benzoate membrane transport protein
VLIVTLSGVAFFSVGSAFWGILAGLAVYLLERQARARTGPRPAGAELPVAAPGGPAASADAAAD